MSQTRPLIDTLKKELRKQRITYKHVSEALGLSETSVKRLFSEEAFSIKRFEKVCELLHLDISDLVHLMERNIEMTSQFTQQQEQELVSDIKLLLIALLLMNKLTFKEIIGVYRLRIEPGSRTRTYHGLAGIGPRRLFLASGKSNGEAKECDGEKSGRIGHELGIFR